MEININTYYYVNGNNTNDGVTLDDNSTTILYSGDPNLPAVDFTNNTSEQSNDVVIGKNSTVIVKSSIKNANIVGDNSAIIADNDSFLFENCTFEGTFTNCYTYATNFGCISNLGTSDYEWDYFKNWKLTYNDPSDRRYYYARMFPKRNVKVHIPTDNNNYDNYNSLQYMFKSASYFNDSTLYINGDFYSYFNDEPMGKPGNTSSGSRHATISFGGYKDKNGIQQKTNNLNIVGNVNTHSKLMTGLIISYTNNLKINNIDILGYHQAHELPPYVNESGLVFPWPEGSISTPNYDYAANRIKYERWIEQYYGSGGYPNKYPYKSNYELYGFPGTYAATGNYKNIGLYSSSGIMLEHHNTNSYIYNVNIEMHDSGIAVGKKGGSGTAANNLLNRTNSNILINNCNLSYFIKQPIGSHSSYCTFHDITTYYCNQAIDFSEGSNYCYGFNIKCYRSLWGWKFESEFTNNADNEGHSLAYYSAYNHVLDNVYYEMTNNAYYKYYLNNPDNIHPAPMTIDIRESLPYIAQGKKDRPNTWKNITLDCKLAYVIFDNWRTFQFRNACTYIENCTFNLHSAYQPTDETKNINANWTNSANTISTPVYKNFVGEYYDDNNIKQNLNINVLPSLKVYKGNILDYNYYSLLETAGAMNSTTSVTIPAEEQYNDTYVYLKNTVFNVDGKYFAIINNNKGQFANPIQTNNLNVEFSNVTINKLPTNKWTTLSNIGFGVFGNMKTEGNIVKYSPIKINKLTMASPGLIDTNDYISTSYFCPENGQYKTSDNKYLTKVIYNEDNTVTYMGVNIPDMSNITKINYNDLSPVYDNTLKKNVVEVSSPNVELVFSEDIGGRENYISNVHIIGNDTKVTIEGNDKERVIFGDNVSFGGTFCNSQIFATNFGFIEGLEKRPWIWTHGGKVPTWTQHDNGTWDNSFVNTYIWTYIHTNNPEYVSPYNDNTDVGTNNTQAKNRLGEFLSYSNNIDICFNGDFFFESGPVLMTDETTSNDGSPTIRNYMVIRNAHNLNIHGQYSNKWKTNSTITGGFNFHGGKNIDFHNFNFVGYHGLHEFPASFSPSTFAAYLMPISLMKDSGDSTVSTTDLQNFKNFAQKYQSYMPYKGLIDRFGYLYTFEVASNWSKYGKYFKNKETIRLGYFGLVDAAPIAVEESTHKVFNFKGSRYSTSDTACLIRSVAENSSATKNVFRKFIDNNNNQTDTDTGKPRVFFDPTCNYYQGPVHITAGNLINIKNNTTGQRTQTIDNVSVINNGRHTYIYVDYDGEDGSCVMTNIINNSKYKLNKNTWYETYMNRPFWASFNKDVMAYAYVTEYKNYKNSSNTTEYYSSIWLNNYSLEILDEMCDGVKYHDCHTEMRTHGFYCGEKESHTLARNINIYNSSFDHIWWQPIGTHGSYVNVSNVYGNYCLQGIDISTGANNFNITNSTFENNIIGFKSDSNEFYHIYTYNITFDNIKYVNQNKFWTDVVNNNTDPNKSGMFYSGTSLFDTQLKYDRYNNEGIGNVNIKNSSFIRNHAYLPKYRNTGNKMVSSYGNFTNCVFEYNWSWLMTDNDSMTYSISYWSGFDTGNNPYIFSTYNKTNKKFEPLNINVVKVRCPNGNITYIPKNWEITSKSSWESVNYNNNLYYIIDNNKIIQYQNNLNNNDVLSNINISSNNTWFQPVYDIHHIFNFGDGGSANCLSRTNEKQNVDGTPNYTYFRNYSSPMLIMNNCYIVSYAQFASIFGTQTQSMLYNINDSYLIYKNNGTTPLHSGPRYHQDFSSFYPNYHLMYDLNNFYVPGQNTYIDKYGNYKNGLYQKADYNFNEPTIDSKTIKVTVNDKNEIKKYNYPSLVYTTEGDFRNTFNYPAWYRNVLTGDIDYTTIKRYYPMKNGWKANHNKPNDCVTMYYSGNSLPLWEEKTCDIVTVHTDINGITRWFYPQFLICSPYSTSKTELVEYTIYDRNNDDIPLLRIPNDIMGNSWSSTLWNSNSKARAFLTNNNNEKWNAIIDYYWNSVSNQYGDYTNITRTNFVNALETKCYINDSSRKIGIGRGYYKYPFGNSLPDGSGDTVNVNYLSNINGITIQEYIHKKYCGRKIEWEEVINNYFKEDGILNNLNNNIQSWKEKIGNPPFGKHEVILTIPFPCRPANFMHNDKLVWGEINGEIINFVTPEYINKGYPMFKNDSSYKQYTNSEARLKAIKWYVDEVLRQLSIHTYENLEIIGLYCVEETIWCNEDIMKSVSDYVRSKGLKYYWYPYATSNTWVPNSYDSQDMITRFELEQYGVDVGIGQTGWTWKPTKTYQDFLIACDNYKYFKYGIMYEFNYKMLNSKETCAELLERNIELWKICKDDPAFIAENNLSKSYIAKSAMMNWYYDAWFPAQVTNMCNVYRFNLENHTDAEAEAFAEQLHPWQYETTDYNTGLTITTPTQYEVENGKVYMYYANKAENGRIEDIQMQQTAELMDDIAITVYNRNFFATF